MYIKSDFHLIRTPPPSGDFCMIPKIRMKHFGYTFNHIKNSSLSFLSECHLIFGREAGPMNMQGGDKIKMREKHHICYSLPSILCWFRVLLYVSSLVLSPQESMASVHGPAVISHYQNSQAPICSNPIRPPVYQVFLNQSVLSWELRKFHRFHLAASEEIWKAFSDSTLLDMAYHLSVLGRLHRGACGHSPIIPQTYQNNEV